MISILCIVAYHANLRLNYNADGIIVHGSLTANQIFLNYIGIWGQLGVNCFIFISAYFLSEKRNIHFENVLGIVLECIFYSVLVYGILCACGIETFSLNSFVKEILSFALGRYWFITSYLALYILSPYLNIMLNNLEKLQLQKISMLLFIGVCCYRMLFKTSLFGDCAVLIALYVICYT
ncbi:TPA: acyltransferase family protein, partial [Enterococcus faecium]|nr:acyltransferase family protein [Enterococcus faecium]NTM85884.1 acyltransferase family protein [Enterococcus faecium]HAP8864445.1 acyltransferase family protein [Enterococcus faecium]